MQVVQRNAKHGIGHHTAIVKYCAVESRVVLGIRDHDGFARFGDHPLYAQPVFHSDAGDIRRANMKQGCQAVGGLVQQPDRPRFAVQGIVDDFKASRERVANAIDLQKLLHDFPGDPSIASIRRHAQSLLSCGFYIAFHVISRDSISFENGISKTFICDTPHSTTLQFSESVLPAAHDPRGFGWCPC